MTARQPDEQGFLDLWPTLFLQRHLPGHEAANQALAQLVRDLDSRHAELTTDYLRDNLLAGEHPAIAWLRDCINKTVIDYLQRCGMNYAINWTLQGWANINRRGDYHDLHNHPHAYLSGTYYVAVPAHLDKTAQNRGDLRPGCISFYDPRGATNMTAIKGDPQIEAEYTIAPTPGLLLLWPAFIHHFVHPNLSGEERISISYNVILKWSDDYLPEQP